MPSPSDIGEKEHTTPPQGSMLPEARYSSRAAAMLEESVDGAKHECGQAPVGHPWLAALGEVLQSFSTSYKDQSDNGSHGTSVSTSQ